MKINKGKKISLPIDVNTGVANGPNVKNFNNYLRVVAHERISILTDSWDHVTSHFSSIEEGNSVDSLKPPSPQS